MAAELPQTPPNSPKLRRWPLIAANSVMGSQSSSLLLTSCYGTVPTNEQMLEGRQFGSGSGIEGGCQCGW
jgi:hypothetical protein